MEFGDFVFLKPNKNVEPFYIGRITNFKDDQVQVNWFYRFRDLHGRGEVRELIASMDCDWNPISSIHSKITVRHLSQVKDLKEFKLQDSCFYYDKLYDKYTKKFYQVIPLSQINNLPNQYKNLLKTEFLLIEEKSQKKFTQRRNCAACETWVNPTESNVVCSKCRRGFHLGCVGLKKELPKKGYGWVCGLCTQARSDIESCSDLTEFSDISEDDEIDQIETGKFASSENKWPWRYFGDYSRIDDLVNDPEGRPKAGSRIGRNFQAIDLPVPGMEPIVESKSNVPGETEPLGNNNSFISKSEIVLKEEKIPEVFQTDDAGVTVIKKRGRGRPRKSDVSQVAIKVGYDGKKPSSSMLVKRKEKRKIDEKEFLIPERGINETVFNPRNVSSNELNDFLDRVHSQFGISNNNSELIQVSLQYLHTFKYDSDEAMQHLSKKPLRDLVKEEWSPDDIQLFERCFLEYGMDLSRIKGDIPQKSMKEITLFFYRWKNSPRFISLYNQYRAKTRAKTKDSDSKSIALLSDLNSEASSESDADSIIDVSTYKFLQCGWCKAKSSQTWKIRHILKKICLCSDCDIYWMKYAIPRKDITTVDVTKKENIASKPEVVVSSPGKRPLLEEESQPKKKTQQLIEVERFGFQVEFLPEDVDVETEEELNHRPCSICCEGRHLADIENPLMVCMDCKVKVHLKCYGATPNIHNDFRCDRCANIKRPELSLDYSCVLCLRSFPSKLCGIKKTIGNNWAHLVCAIWIPEIKFGIVASKKPIEGIGHIDYKSWGAKHTCEICKTSDGITIQCCERSCNTYIHASCASINPQYVTNIGEMRGSNLAFQPMLFCLVHSKKWKNKSSLEQSQTDLINQYVAANKKTQEGFFTTGDKRAYSFLLNDSCACHIASPKKITKNIKNATPLKVAVENRVQKSCFKCSNDLSPFWWPIPPMFDADGHEESDGRTLYECQNCKWGRTTKINR